MRLWFLSLLSCIGLLGPSVVFGYPSVERKPSTQTQPPLDLGLQTATGYAISDDDGSLYVTFGETFKIVDLGTYALAGSQPYAIAGDTDLTGAIKGIAYLPALKTVYATQEGGHLLLFDLAKVTEKPTRVTVASGKTLSHLVADPDAGNLYILNSTDTQLLQYAIGTSQSIPIDLKGAISGNFTVNQLLFVRSVSGGAGVCYASTNVGRVIAIPTSTHIPTAITVDSGGTHDLKGMAALPDSSALYVVDPTDKTVRKIATATGTATATINLTANSDINQIAVAEVTKPTGTYGFVAGSKGLSVFDTGNNDVLDLGSTSTDDEPLPISGSGPILASDDGYLYISFGKIAVVSDNPWITVSKVEYGGGKSSLGVGGTTTLTFEADEAGTYVVRSGGTVAGNGTTLTDTGGATSGTVGTANTAQTVTFAYDTNSSALQEGSNTVYIFATDADGNTGRRAATVTVDTPPPAVTIQSVSFGTSKIYVNLQRLDVADIAEYRVYVDTDPAAVLTKTAADATAPQPAAGNEPTVVVTDLSNKTTYYIAAEAKDTNGNVSPTRTNAFASGTVASGKPEATVGPAGRAGETGCTMVEGNGESPWFGSVCLGLLVIAMLLKRRIVASTLAILVFLTAGAAEVRGEEPERFAPAQWTFALQGGVWLPTGSVAKEFFGACCSPTGMMEGGYLIKERFGFELGVGGFYDSGVARGVDSGELSQDSFALLLIPLTTNVTVRGRFWPRQSVIPFLRGGADAIFFRENDAGTVIKGIKWGLHGGLGMQVSLRHLTKIEPEFEFGVKDASLLVEGRYRWVDNFGKGGLDLSGLLGTVGILMEF